MRATKTANRRTNLCRRVRLDLLSCPSNADLRPESARGPHELKFSAVCQSCRLKPQPKHAGSHAVARPSPVRTASGRFDTFATPSGNGRYLRAP